MKEIRPSRRRVPLQQAIFISRRGSESRESPPELGVSLPLCVRRPARDERRHDDDDCDYDEPPAD